MNIVKVHRVFLSSCLNSASAQKFQFHGISTGDREEVVTPFMQVGTYPTRNFATLEPSGLQLPFTWSFKKKLIGFTIFFTFPVPGRCQTLYIIIII